jgi:hypothetical protein
MVENSDTGVCPRAPRPRGPPSSQCQTRVPHTASAPTARRKAVIRSPSGPTTRTMYRSVQNIERDHAIEPKYPADRARGDPGSRAHPPTHPPRRLAHLSDHLSQLARRVWRRWHVHRNARAVRPAATGPRADAPVDAAALWWMDQQRRALGAGCVPRPHADALCGPWRPLQGACGGGTRARQRRGAPAAARRLDGVP